MHDIHELFGEISDKALDVVRGFIGNDKYMQKNVGVYKKRVMVQNLHTQRFMVLDISCRALCKMCPTSIYRKKNKYKTKKDYLIFWNGICENDKYHYNKHEVPPQECEHDRVMIAVY